MLKNFEKVVEKALNAVNLLHSHDILIRYK